MRDSLSKPTNRRATPEYTTIVSRASRDSTTHEQPKNDYHSPSAKRSQAAVCEDDSPAKFHYRQMSACVAVSNRLRRRTDEVNARSSPRFGYCSSGSGDSPANKPSSRAARNHERTMSGGLTLIPCPSSVVAAERQVVPQMPILMKRSDQHQRRQSMDRTTGSHLPVQQQPWVSPVPIWPFYAHQPQASVPMPTPVGDRAGDDVAAQLKDVLDQNVKLKSELEALVEKMKQESEKSSEEKKAMLRRVEIGHSKQIEMMRQRFEGEASEMKRKHDKRILTLGSQPCTNCVRLETEKGVLDQRVKAESQRVGILTEMKEKLQQKVDGCRDKLLAQEKELDSLRGQLVQVKDDFVQLKESRLEEKARMEKMAAIVESLELEVAEARLDARRFREEVNSTRLKLHTSLENHKEDVTMMRKLRQENEALRSTVTAFRDPSPMRIDLPPRRPPRSSTDGDGCPESLPVRQEPNPRSVDVATNDSVSLHRWDSSPARSLHASTDAKPLSRTEWSAEERLSRTIEAFLNEFAKGSDKQSYRETQKTHAPICPEYRKGDESPEVCKNLYAQIRMEKDQALHRIGSHVIKKPCSGMLHESVARCFETSMKPDFISNLTPSSRLERSSSMPISKIGGVKLTTGSIGANTTATGGERTSTATTSHASRESNCERPCLNMLGSDSGSSGLVKIIDSSTGSVRYKVRHLDNDSKNGHRQSVRI